MPTPTDDLTAIREERARLKAERAKAAASASGVVPAPVDDLAVIREERARLKAERARTQETRLGSSATTIEEPSTITPDVVEPPTSEVTASDLLPSTSYEPGLPAKGKATTNADVSPEQLNAELAFTREFVSGINPADQNPKPALPLPQNVLTAPNPNALSETTARGLKVEQDLADYVRGSGSSVPFPTPEQESYVIPKLAEMANVSREAAPTIVGSPGATPSRLPFLGESRIYDVSGTQLENSIQSLRAQLITDKKREADAKKNGSVYSPMSFEERSKKTKELGTLVAASTELQRRIVEDPETTPTMALYKEADGAWRQPTPFEIMVDTTYRQPLKLDVERFHSATNDDLPLFAEWGRERESLSASGVNLQPTPAITETPTGAFMRSLGAVSTVIAKTISDSKVAPYNKETQVASVFDPNLEMTPSIQPTAIEGFRLDANKGRGLTTDIAGNKYMQDALTAKGAAAVGIITDIAVPTPFDVGDIARTGAKATSALARTNRTIQAVETAAAAKTLTSKVTDGATKVLDEAITYAGKNIGKTAVDAEQVAAARAKLVAESRSVSDAEVEATIQTIRSSATPPAVKEANIKSLRATHARAKSASPELTATDRKILYNIQDSLSVEEQVRLRRKIYGQNATIPTKTVDGKVSYPGLEEAKATAREEAKATADVLYKESLDIRNAEMKAAVDKNIETRKGLQTKLGEKRRAAVEAANAAEAKIEATREAATAKLMTTAEETGSKIKRVAEASNQKVAARQAKLTEEETKLLSQYEADRELFLSNTPKIVSAENADVQAELAKIDDKLKKMITASQEELTLRKANLPVEEKVALIKYRTNREEFINLQAEKLNKLMAAAEAEKAKTVAKYQQKVDAIEEITKEATEKKQKLQAAIDGINARNDEIAKIRAQQIDDLVENDLRNLPKAEDTFDKVYVLTQKHTENQKRLIENATAARTALEAEQKVLEKELTSLLTKQEKSTSIDAIITARNEEIVSMAENNKIKLKEHDAAVVKALKKLDPTEDIELGRKSLDEFADKTSKEYHEMVDDIYAQGTIKAETAVAKKRQTVRELMADLDTANNERAVKAFDDVSLFEARIKESADAKNSRVKAAVDAELTRRSQITNTRAAREVEIKKLLTPPKRVNIADLDSPVGLSAGQKADWLLNQIAPRFGFKGKTAKKGGADTVIVSNRVLRKHAKKFAAKSPDSVAKIADDTVAAASAELRLTNAEASATLIRRMYGRSVAATEEAEDLISIADSMNKALTVDDIREFARGKQLAFSEGDYAKARIQSFHDARMGISDDAPLVGSSLPQVDEVVNEAGFTGLRNNPLLTTADAITRRTVLGPKITGTSPRVIYDKLQDVTTDLFLVSDVAGADINIYRKAIDDPTQLKALGFTDEQVKLVSEYQPKPTSAEVDRRRLLASDIEDIFTNAVEKKNPMTQRMIKALVPGETNFYDIVADAELTAKRVVYADLIKKGASPVDAAKQTESIFLSPNASLGATETLFNEAFVNWAINSYRYLSRPVNVASKNQKLITTGLRAKYQQSRLQDPEGLYGDTSLLGFLVPTGPATTAVVYAPGFAEINTMLQYGQRLSSVQTEYMQRGALSAAQSTFIPNRNASIEITPTNATKSINALLAAADATGNVQWATTLLNLKARQPPTEYAKSPSNKYVWAYAPEDGSVMVKNPNEDVGGYFVYEPGAATNGILQALNTVTSMGEVPTALTFGIAEQVDRSNGRVDFNRYAAGSVSWELLGLLVETGVVRSTDAQRREIQKRYLEYTRGPIPRPTNTQLDALYEEYEKRQTDENKKRAMREFNQ